MRHRLLLFEADRRSLRQRTGSSVATQSPSRRSLKRPDRLGWAQRCLSGQMEVVIMEMLRVSCQA